MGGNVGDQGADLLVGSKPVEGARMSGGGESSPKDHTIPEVRRAGGESRGRPGVATQQGRDRGGVGRADGVARGARNADKDAQSGENPPAGPVSGGDEFFARLS